METAAIKIENLTYVYEFGFVALKNINLTIKQNEFVGMIGQNGAGKSTLLKNITGLLKPTEGNVFVAGVNTRDVTVAELATRAGFVLQNPDHQLFAATVEEEVSFGPKNLGLTPEEVAERVQTALQWVGLEEMRQEFPPALSKGDRAKVVIASVLAMRPEIIILDEPTSGQDYRGCYQIMDIAREFHRAGHTVVVVTHHMALVAEYTERIIVLGQGEILLDDSTRVVFAQSERLRLTHIAPPQITQLGFELAPVLGLKEAVLRVPELGDAVMAKLRGGRQP
ncbi:ATP-binding cassette domain-containing protein [Moorella naiadis]|uniref:energy-coupling factor ABC transporter ATP-binding protein n=1 Tax=Moorella naiadis (nom. illeg.) TaxID=3093670 RepID=UPI003D9C80A1